MMRSASWSRGRHAGCHARPEDHHAWEERGPIGSTNVRNGKQREPRGHDHRAEGQGQSLAVVVATGDIDIIAPGFAADSLESLEEIAIRYASLYGPWRRRAALHSGIERLARTYQGTGEPAAPSSSGLGARSAYLLRPDAG
jgi:hypothetical protein